MKPNQLTFKRINIQTSAQVDKMFRTQAHNNGMNMTEYFKHLVVFVDFSMKMSDLYNQQTNAIVKDLMKERDL